MAYEREKQIAIESALAAAKLCEQVRINIPPAMEKGDKSPVTVADYGAQALICKALAEAFPMIQWWEKKMLLSYKLQKWQKI